MSGLSDFEAIAAAHRAGARHDEFPEKTSDALLDPRALRRRYDAYKRPLLVAALVATGVGVLASGRVFNFQPRAEPNRGSQVALRPPTPHPLAAVARAGTTPTVAPFATITAKSVYLSDRSHVPPPQLKYLPLPETPEQLAAPFVKMSASEASVSSPQLAHRPLPESPGQAAGPIVKIAASETSRGPHGDPDAASVRLGDGVYEIRGAADGAIDPQLANQGHTIASTQEALSAGQDGTDGVGEVMPSAESAAQTGPAGFAKNAMLPTDPQPLSAPAGRLAPSPSSDPPALLPDSETVGEEAQGHNEVPATVEARETYDAVRESADGTPPVQGANAANEATASSITAKSVTKRAFELTLPMQIQGVDAGNVQLRVENDRVLISLASLLQVVKPRMETAEFAKLSSSNNASAYISTDELRNAGFAIGFDPTTVSLVMSTH